MKLRGAGPGKELTKDYSWRRLGSDLEMGDLLGGKIARHTRESMTFPAERQRRQRDSSLLGWLLSELQGAARLSAFPSPLQCWPHWCSHHTVWKWILVKLRGLQRDSFDCKSQVCTARSLLRGSMKGRSGTAAYLSLNVGWKSVLVPGTFSDSMARKAERALETQLRAAKSRSRVWSFLSAESSKDLKTRAFWIRT